MSGIAALFDRAGPDRALLNHLTDVMDYRAPDGTACWNDDEVGLGFALLRTSTRGEQADPAVVHDETAGLHIVADARIDDRHELVRKLRTAGVTVRGCSPDPRDTAPDLILAAWKAWGRSCAEHLVGVFAFVLWDANRRTLYAARDAFGVKPLMIARPGGPGGSIVISNTLPVLLEHPRVSRTPDEDSLADHLLWGAITDERRTYFADIEQIERGSWWCWSAEGERSERWWCLPDVEPTPVRKQAGVLEEFDALLRRAVGDRLPDPERTTVLQLSGGLDSAAIATVSRELRGPAALTAVTAGFERLLPDDEPRLAAVTARALGLRHELLTSDDWVEPIAGMIDNAPSWGASPPPWPLGPGGDGTETFISRLAQLGRVTLTGWDGDAVLYGDAPEALRAPAASGDLATAARDIVALGRHAFILGRAPRARFRGALRSLMGSETVDPLAGYPERWFTEDAELAFQLKDRWAGAHAQPTREERRDPRRRARSTLAAPLWSDLFQNQDPGWTGQGIEARHPLMDLRLVRFFLSLPVIPWCVEKGILRLWLKSRVPKEIWKRPKQGLRGDPEAELLRARQRADPAALRARVGAGTQDPPLLGRFLVADWKEQLLHAIENHDGDNSPIHRGLYAHAAARWLGRLDEHP